MSNNNKNRNKKKLRILLVKFLLVIFILIGFGLADEARAVGWCDSDDHSKAICPNKGDIRLQVGIPGLSSSCSYQPKVIKDGKLVEDSPIKTLYCVKGFPEYIESIYKMFIGIVGILAVIMIMVGGFQWLLAAGNAQKISGAKATIISAVMGLVLALMSYTILNIVNPNLTNLSLKVKPPEVLTEEETKGLCTKADNPILREDKSIGPKCGKIYALMESVGGKQFCVGFYTGPGDKGGCYKESGKNTQKVRSLQIEDYRPGGFGIQDWEFLNVNNSGDTLKKYCGELYVYKDGDEYIYNIGMLCPDNSKKEKFCVINEDVKKGVTFDGDLRVSIGNNAKKVGRLNGWSCPSW